MNHYEREDAIWGLDVERRMKVVLLALSHHANADLVCWPSHSRLIRMTGFKKSWLNDTLDVLETYGLIQRERQRGKNTRYTLRLIQPVDYPTERTTPDTGLVQPVESTSPLSEHDSSTEWSEVVQSVDTNGEGTDQEADQRTNGAPAREDGLFTLTNPEGAKPKTKAERSRELAAKYHKDAGIPGSGIPYPDEYQAILDVYPDRGPGRKLNERVGYTAWRKLVVERLIDPALLLASVRNYAKDCERLKDDDRKYVSMISSFFGRKETWTKHAPGEADTTEAAWWHEDMEHFEPHKRPKAEWAGWTEAEWDFELQDKDWSRAWRLAHMINNPRRGYEPDAEQLALVDRVRAEIDAKAQRRREAQAQAQGEVRA